MDNAIRLAGLATSVVNLLALGVPRIFPIGVLGDDPFGRELGRLLHRPEIDTQGLVVQPQNWATHSYVKAYVEGRELNRLDHGNYNQLSRETEALFFSRLEQVMTQVSVVLMNHQVIGSIHDSPSFRSGWSASSGSAQTSVSSSIPANITKPIPRQFTSLTTRK